MWPVARGCDRRRGASVVDRGGTLSGMPNDDDDRRPGEPAPIREGEVGPGDVLDEGAVERTEHDELREEARERDQRWRDR